MIELFAGLHGWGEGAVTEGFRVIGFDIIDMVREIGAPRPPADIQLVLQDVLTLHGKQFKDAALIVASPPCQAYSYRAMPWSRAKALPSPDNSLFEACFRIQAEAIKAAGHFIPLVVENVRGAQKWVGRSRWNYGSFHLWGDVPALMPMTTQRRMKSQIPCTSILWSERIAKTNEEAHALHYKLPSSLDNGYERNHPAAFGWKKPRTSSKSNARKAASAMIPKIPLPLSRHIAAYWKPVWNDSNNHPRDLYLLGADQG